MISDLTKYAQVKITPSTINILSVQNPLGIVPKYIHITCDNDSAPYLSNGYIREFQSSQWLGHEIGTNGSNGTLLQHPFYPVSETPTAVNRFHLSESIIEIYKGNGSISGRWHTGTEYTVHIYA